jgi:hypothetical protein
LHKRERKRERERERERERGRKNFSYLITVLIKKRTRYYYINLMNNANVLLHKRDARYEGSSTANEIPLYAFIRATNVGRKEGRKAQRIIKTSDTRAKNKSQRDD